MDDRIKRAIQFRADQLAFGMDPQTYGRVLHGLTELLMTHHGGVTRDLTRGSFPKMVETLEGATLESLHLREPPAKYVGGDGAGHWRDPVAGAVMSSEDAAIEALNREVTTLRRQLLNAEASLEDVDEALATYAAYPDNPYRRDFEQTTAECVLALVEKMHEAQATIRVLEERNAQLQAERQ